MILLWEGIVTVVGGVLKRVIMNPFTAAALAIALFSVWNMLVDNPRVRREATANLVSKFELESEKAARLEADRQVLAGEAALARLQKLLTEQELAQEAEDVEREQQIADYERRLAEEHRQCLLSVEDKQVLSGRGRKDRK